MYKLCAHLWSRMRGEFFQQDEMAPGVKHVWMNGLINGSAIYLVCWALFSKSILFNKWVILYQSGQSLIPKPDPYYMG